MTYTQAYFSLYHEYELRSQNTNVATDYVFLCEQLYVGRLPLFSAINYLIFSTKLSFV